MESESSNLDIDLQTALSQVLEVGASAVTDDDLLFTTPHGGGLVLEGCHNNRKISDRPCHRSRRRYYLFVILLQLL